MDLPFCKYVATGNDFIIIELASTRMHFAELATLAPQLCDRHFGIGADGILYIDSSARPPTMRIINADGSIAEICGNGLRCAARYLVEFAKKDAPDLQISCDAGIKNATIVHAGALRDAFLVEVDMGNVVFGDSSVIHIDDVRFVLHALNVGNPHAVTFVDEDPMPVAQKFGAALSTHPLFTQGCNIEFVRLRDTGNVDMAVFERGVGITLACGSGCVAVGAVYARHFGSQPPRLHIQLPGGNIDVDFPTQNEAGYILRGTVNFVFEGTWKLR